MTRAIDENHTKRVCIVLLVEEQQPPQGETLNISSIYVDIVNEIILLIAYYVPVPDAPMLSLSNKEPQNWVVMSLHSRTSSRAASQLLF